ncbi:MAG: DUF507 family protein [Nitrospira sp.]|nr:DUF507 family protein [bacterium]MBL7048305.1 DUF507 family protein [Nitrospira sp.]
MKLSDDKISHMAHISLKALKEKDALKLLAEDSEVRREIKRIIVKELRLAEDIDEVVQKKLQSYSKKIYEGTNEWDIMYNKLFEEESSKKGRG